MRTKRLTAFLLAALCIQSLGGSAFAHTPPSRKPSRKKIAKASVAAMATLVETPMR
jgi:hypothetical protein